ncbi:hypothetical protein [Ferrimicrobium sp.]|uniref:hypothetical protein n=1 Tax=Ferrimicrobium sp. TaxID=2926050 RepID=UPI0026376475|nr:hypothetical protein [Ferrimicrobium sp.]
MALRKTTILSLPMALGVAVGSKAPTHTVSAIATSANLCAERERIEIRELESPWTFGRFSRLSVPSVKSSPAMVVEADSEEDLVESRLGGRCERQIEVAVKVT